jgi:hypothetical protein
MAMCVGRVVAVAMTMIIAVYFPLRIIAPVRVLRNKTHHNIIAVPKRHPSNFKLSSVGGRKP